MQSDSAWGRWKESTGDSRQIVPQVIPITADLDNDDNFYDDDGGSDDDDNDNDHDYVINLTGNSCRYRLIIISWCWFLGLVTEEIFYSIFSKFFPLGGDTYSGE